MDFVFGFLTYAVKDLPAWLAWGGVAFGIVLVARKPLITFAAKNHVPIDKKFNRIYVGVSITLVLLAGLLAWTFAPSVEGEPDVSLKFVYPTSPALVLTNNTNAVANQIKWTVVLWNLDDPRAYAGAPPDNPPDAHEALQIPVSTFDFIRAHSTGGPLNLFGSPLVAPYVKSGNRLAGFASAICPNCTRGHTYFVWIVYGQGGWLAELSQYKNGEVISPRPQTRANVANFFDQFMPTVPEKDHMPILNN
jgi:hypothetical protein